EAGVPRSAEGCRRRSLRLSARRSGDDRRAARRAPPSLHAGDVARQPVRRAGAARRRDRHRYPGKRRFAGARDHRGIAREIKAMTDRRRYRLATEVAHLGRDPRRFLGAVNTPVFRASTILMPNVAALQQAARGEFPGLSYGLHGLPTVTDLQHALATLEGGHAALLVPSGLTATTFPLLALAKRGDHVLVTDAVYGPTRRFCDNHLRRLGIDVSYYDPLLGAEIAREFRPRTALVFTESPGSLTFEVQDIPAIVEVAHARGARVILDNTWATPLGFRAFDHGVDVSVHAVTKYIGGHSDLLLGAIIANASTYPALHRLWTDMGVTPSPDDCFLGLRGLRTLAVRLARHAERAMQVARWLAQQPGVRDVLYPALPGD